MNVVLPNRPTVDEFLAWSVRQERGKFELFDGVVVMQQSQQWEHAKVKLEIVLVLRDAIQRAGLAYYAAPDGMTVRIGERTAFEPDALVAPLPEPDRKSLEVPNPTIVVEVLSPSTARGCNDKAARLLSGPERPALPDPGPGWAHDHAPQAWRG